MSVSVIIPAYRAAGSIGATVAAARSLPGVREVIVVDDGSGDGTGEEARRAGADQVIVFPRNRGKGAALSAGVEAAGEETLLFLDSDLGESAAHAAPLLEAVAGRCAMSIAVLPTRNRVGGFGFAKGLSAAAIRLLTGLQVQAPLSGQRALPADLVRHLGLGSRWSVETALTIEAAHLGVPIIEVPVDLDHHHTGRTGSGFRHRFGQFWDILKYVVLVGYGLGWTGLSRRRIALRTALWLAGFAGLIGLGVRAPMAWGPYMEVIRSPGAGSCAPLPAAYLLALIALMAAALWLPTLWLTSIVLGSRKSNFLGRRIPGAAGLIIPLVALPCIWLVCPNFRPLALWVAVVGGFGALGILDDLYGHLGKARGFRGHFRALLHGRVTTGAAKAIGGLIAGLAAGYLLEGRRPHGPGVPLLDGLVIALTANLLNLLDLRPGRALKAILVMAAPQLVATYLNIHGRGVDLPLVGPALAAALVLAPADLAGRVMLGDVGANTLGAIAGLELVIVFSPLGRLIALAVLIAIHIYCEHASLTDLIARNRVLCWLDRLGTEGRPPLAVKEPVP